VSKIPRHTTKQKRPTLASSVYSRCNRVSFACCKVVLPSERSRNSEPPFFSVSRHWLCL